MNAPRFEVCRGDSGWWARFRAANGRVVFVTETYTRRRAALTAIAALARPLLGSVEGDRVTVYNWLHGDNQSVEVREIDERGKP